MKCGGGEVTAFDVTYTHKENIKLHISGTIFILKCAEIETNFANNRLLTENYNFACGSVLV
jgi:hypothetical protein